MIKSTTVRGWATSAILVPITVLAGCGEVLDLEANTPGGAEQAAINGYAAALSSIDISEGGSSNLVISKLCVDQNIDGTTVNIDWGDGSAVEPHAFAVGDYVANTASCPGALFEVCGSTTACSFAHTFGDDSAQQVGAFAGRFNVVATAQHNVAAGTQQQQSQITVRNVAPAILSFTRAGNTEEGSSQTFTAAVNDPGLRATEIKSVVVSVAPAGDAAPATITCTCSASPDCGTAGDTPLCSTAGAGDVNFVFPTTLLDNSSFVATITVTDEDDAVTTTTTTPALFTNVVPEVAAVRLTEGASTVLAAIDPLAPTSVREGSPFDVELQLRDQGIDLLAFTGDLTSDGTNELAGSVQVNATTRPNTVASTDLTETGFRWNDNNDANPASFATTLSFTVDDGDGGSIAVNRFVSVVDVNPIIASITPSSTTVNEGDTVTTTVVASDGDFGSTFDNIGSNAATGSFRWTVKQGAGAARDVTANSSLAGIYDVVAGTCTRESTTCGIKFLDDTGDSYVVGVTVFDEDSSASADATAISVNNVLPTIASFVVNGGSATINEGGTATVAVSGFDPALTLDGSYTLTVSYGNGSANDTTTVTTFTAPASAFAAQSELYVDNDVCNGPNSTSGTCTVTAQICEVPGAPIAGPPTLIPGPGPGGFIIGPGAPIPAPPLCSTIAQTTLTVLNVAPTATATAPSGLTLIEGVAFALDGTFTDPAAGLDDDYAFSWSYSDNGTARSATGSSTFVNRTTGVDVASAPIFTNVPAAGLTNVAFGLTVTDEDLGVSTVATVNSNVRDAVPTTTLLTVAFPDGAAELATPEVTFTVAPENSADLLTSVVISWGDNTTTTLTAVAAAPGPGQFLNTGATLTVEKPTAYPDSDSNRATAATDPWAITVTVNDEETTSPTTAITGRNPIATVNATVTNVAPTIVSIVPGDNPVIVSEGQAAAFIITTTDVSPADRADAAFNLTVNWGDGSAIETFATSTGVGSNQAFRAAHVYNNPRSANVTFTISDREGATDSESIVIEVVNIAPTITDLVNTGPVPEGVPVTVAALTDNRGADVLTYSFNFACTLPADAADFGAAPGVANPSAVASNTYGDNGSNNVCVRVCDDDGQPNSCAFASTVVRVDNAAPVITSFSPPATITEGGSVTLSATATDLGGVNDTLTFSFDCTDDGVVDAPANTTTTHSCTYGTSGTFTARLTVTDGDGGSATQTTTVRVTNLPPTAPVVAGNTVNEGAASTITVTPGATGNGGAATRFEYDFDNNGIVDAVTANTTATFAYATDGTKIASVRACDAEGACTAPVLTPASGVGAIVVTNVAPVITTVNAPATVRIGSPVTVSVEATDAGRDALTYKFDFNTTPPQSVTTSAPFATVTINQVGTITATVTVTDVATAPAVPLTDTETKTFSVTSDAGRLTAFSTATPSINEGGTVVLAATAADQGGGDFDFVFDCANGSTAVIAAPGATSVLSASATCSYGDNGSFLARVKATDDDGNTDERTLLVVVANVAPTLTSATLTTVGAVIEGGTASFATVATDAAGSNDTIRFDYDFDGNGTIDLGTAALTASSVFPRDGAIVTKVRACDEDGGCSAFSDVAVAVGNAAPVIASVSAPASSPVGNALSVTATATDAGNDPLTFTFVFTVAGVVTTVGPQASASATITPLTAGAGTVSVTANDGTATSIASVATFTVADEAPRLTSFTTAGNVSTVNEDGSLVFTAVATDRGGGALTLQIDCTGNGVSADDPVAGASGTCTYGKSGPVAPSVTVTDVAGLSDVRSLNILVRNVAPAAPVAATTTATVDEGTTVAFTATSTDAAGDVLRFEYDFDNNGNFETTSTTGNASFRFPEDGSKTVVVRACDDENACSTTSTVNVSVTNIAPVIENFDVPTSSLVGSAVTVSVDASDVGGDTLSYAFELSLGGSIVARVPATGFSASPVASATLLDSGSYLVTAFVRDTSSVLADVKTTTATLGLTVNEISVNVTAQADPAVIDEGQTTNITVNALGTGPYIVSYDTNADGDFNDATDVSDVECAGTPGDPCELRNVRFAQNRAGDLSFRVLVKVIDEGQNDLLSTAIVAVTVNNKAPTIVAVADANAVEGTLLTQTVTANDVGLEDTLSFAVVSAPAGLTIAAGTVARTGLISWTPTFENEGANDVTIKVTDSDGASVDETFTITVAIVDENGNGVSDVEERALNDGELFCENLAACDALADLDSDDDGVSDLDELLAGTDENSSDAPGAPVLISPKDGVEVATITPTLTVANATHTRGEALTYTFCIVDSATDRCMVDVASGETTTSVVFTVSGFALVEGQTYEWYAVANDGLADGVESELGSFVVDAQNEAPGAPDALAPANASEFVEGSSVSLEARAVTDADGDAVSYVFAVSTDAAFAPASTTTSAARAVPLFTIGSALPVGSYFWRATASDGTLSTTGTVGTFTVVAVETNEAPSAPGIVGPSNTTVEATSATLTITAGTDADGDGLVYELELADNAAFANATTSGAQAGLTFAVSDLAEDTTHFWRARAFDGALYSDWATATFVVNAVNAAPAGLAILSPADGSLLLTSPTSFTVANAVDAEGDALSYVFTVATDAAFANVVASGTVEEGTATTVFTSSTAQFDKGTTYFWRVEASDGGTEKATATASFSMFDDSAPDEPIVSGGGCGCSTSSTGDVFGFALFGLVVALRRRRRA